MASKRGAAVEDSGSIEGLVQSINTHKKFKRLAGYSISCLVKLIAPPASDWVNLSLEAARCGAVGAIGEVLQNPTTGDAGIFQHSVAAVASIALSSVRCAAAIAESPALGTILSAFVFYWDKTLPELASGTRGGGLEGEDLLGARGCMKHVADVLHAVSKQAPATLLQQPQGVPVLLRLAVPGFGAATPALSAAGGLVIDLPSSALAMQSLGLVSWDKHCSPRTHTCLLRRSPPTTTLSATTLPVFTCAQCMRRGVWAHGGAPCGWCASLPFLSAILVGRYTTPFSCFLLRHPPPLPRSPAPVS
jgi:hypothetical protein